MTTYCSVKSHPQAVASAAPNIQNHSNRHFFLFQYIDCFYFIERHRRSLFEHQYFAHINIQFCFFNLRAASPQSRRHPAPIGVVAVNGCFQQVGTDNRPRCLPGFFEVGRAFYINFNQFRRAFTVTGNCFGQVNTDLI